MGMEELESKVKELKELEAMQAEITAEMDAIKDDLKAEMARRKTDEMSIGAYMVRHKTIISKRFDSRAFRASHGDLYSRYSRETVSKRFTVQ